MADIALLVTEELGKRPRTGAPGAGGDGGDREPKSTRNFGAVMKVCSSWAEAAVAAVKVNVALLKDRVEEPRTGLAMAAFDGFFSA